MIARLICRFADLHRNDIQCSWLFTDIRAPLYEIGDADSKFLTTTAADQIE